MKSLMELIEAGEPLIQRAVDALRRYREAQAADGPPNEVERLHHEAESLFRAVTDYQLGTLGSPSVTHH
ncbi:hypothetical protein [Pseudomonas sp. HY7a-MNA-CIBAN-0227]|uniref:hypothetical protein n=1 Tax=Pseudomonas sp. HY7a-MNA-CIBAN-0227 TaxID=3140474 RepID=UPI00332F0DAE